MTVEAYTHRVATSTGTGARTPAVCAAAVVHGGSGAEPPERLSARFARPIQGARYLNRATRLAVLAVDQLGLAPGAPVAEARFTAYFYLESQRA